MSAFAPTFVADVRTPRVRFGRGERGRLGEELATLGISRALVLATPDQAAQAQAVLPGAAAYYPHAVMHTPVDGSLRAVAAADGCDGLIAVGGGSTVNLAKAIALRTGLPIVAVPTTYAGSEMTPILGETEDGAKRTLRDARLLPRTVIYDPELYDTMPAAIAGPSGMNALAHAVEALYAHDASPITSAWAAEAIAALGATLPAIVEGCADVDTCDRAVYGAWLAAACLGNSAMGLHHKICHTLGGSFELPHATTHAVMLPYSLAYNEPAVPHAAARIASALGHDYAPAGLHALLAAVSPVTSLAALGMTEDQLDRAAALATASPYPNPRVLDERAIRSMLGQAWAGVYPEPVA